MAVGLQYKKGSGFLYRANAGLKLAALVTLTVCIMALSLPFIAAGIAAAAFAAFFCGWTPREFCADIKPALFYGLLIYAAGIVTRLYAPSAESAGLLRLITPSAEYALYILRLLLVMQLSALMFRTSTSIEIKQTLCDVETYIRRLLKAKLPFARNISPQARLALTVALTISFIPQILAVWTRLNRAYTARCGARRKLGVQNSVRKMRLLLFALITVSLHTAAQKAAAIASREMLS